MHPARGKLLFFSVGNRVGLVGASGVNGRLKELAHYLRYDDRPNPPD
jgi:hypothetical protein